MPHTLFSPPKPNAKMVVTAAIKHALSSSVLGADNKSADIKKTNGWVLFHQYRYNCSGQYVKRTDAFDQGNLKDSVKTDYYVDPHTNEVEMLTTINNYYCVDRDPDKVAMQTVDKQWFYQCNDIDDSHRPDIHLYPKNAKLNPLADKRISLSENNKDLLKLAILAQAKRAFNCKERCAVIAKYLWESNSQFINRIELLNFNYDHTVMVVNRNGELDKPETWGPDALVIDSWCEPENTSSNSPEKYIYTAAEFIERAKAVRQFMHEDRLEQIKMGSISDDNSVIEDTLTWYAINDIDPKTQPYPTKNNKVEDYYELLNVYPTDLLNKQNLNCPLLAPRKEHKATFKYCLADIKHRASAPSPTTDDNDQLEQMNPGISHRK